MEIDGDIEDREGRKGRKFVRGKNFRAEFIRLGFSTPAGSNQSLSLSTTKTQKLFFFFGELAQFAGIGKAILIARVHSSLSISIAGLGSGGHVGKLKQPMQ